MRLPLKIGLCEENKSTKKVLTNEISYKKVYVGKLSRENFFNAEIFCW